MPPGEPLPAAMTQSDSSPEAAGIFRIFHANADPLAAETADASLVTEADAGPVPLPRRRPQANTALSARGTLALAASRHGAEID